MGHYQPSVSDSEKSLREILDLLVRQGLTAATFITEKQADDYYDYLLLISVLRSSLANGDVC